MSLESPKPSHDDSADDARPRVTQSISMTQAKNLNGVFLPRSVPRPCPKLPIGVSGMKRLSDGKMSSRYGRYDGSSSSVDSRASPSPSASVVNDGSTDSFAQFVSKLRHPSDGSSEGKLAASNLSRVSSSLSIFDMTPGDLRTVFESSPPSSSSLGTSPVPPESAVAPGTKPSISAVDSSPSSSSAKNAESDAEARPAKRAKSSHVKFQFTRNVSIIRRK